MTNLSHALTDPCGFLLLEILTSKYYPQQGARFSGPLPPPEALFTAFSQEARVLRGAAHSLPKLYV